MLNLAEEIDTAIAEAVKGLGTRGYSPTEIGSRLGITRRAAAALGDLNLTGNRQHSLKGTARTRPQA